MTIFELQTCGALWAITTTTEPRSESTHLEGLMLEPRVSAQRLPRLLQSVVDLSNVDAQEADH